MRKLLVILLLLMMQNVFAQSKPPLKLFIKMELKFPEYNGGVQNFTANDYGLITGAFAITNYGLGFSSDSYPSSFLTRPSDLFNKMAADPQARFSDAEIDKMRKKDLSWDHVGFNKRKVNFSFTLLENSVSGDSATVCCKYILLKRGKQIASNSFEYNESFFEVFKRVPLNKEFNFMLFSDLYYELTVLTTFRIVDWEAKKLKAQQENKVIHNLNDYVDIYKKLEASMKKSDMGMSNLKIGFEYIRTDKEGKNILEMGKEAVIKGSNLIETKDEFFEIPMNIYLGAITLPFKVYNKEKQAVLDKFASLNTKVIYNYTILVIPLSKKDDVYTFEVYIPRNTLNRTDLFYKKEIQLKIGEKIRIDLFQGHWRYYAKTDGAPIYADGDEDYYPYVNEYYLIGLEKDK